jgi:hypothetical protein
MPALSRRIRKVFLQSLQQNVQKPRSEAKRSRSMLKNSHGAAQVFGMHVRRYGAAMWQKPASEQGTFLA